RIRIGRVAQAGLAAHGLDPARVLGRPGGAGDLMTHQYKKGRQTASNDAGRPGKKNPHVWILEYFQAKCAAVRRRRFDNEKPRTCASAKVSSTAASTRSRPS